jgi:hypothetical protein
VLQCFLHLMLFVRREEGERVPLPFVVNHTVVNLHREVRGDEMMGEGASASGWNVNLLGTL